MSNRCSLLAVATVALVGATLDAQTREHFRIRPGTTVTVQVGKGGLLSFAGHEREGVAPATDGHIQSPTTRRCRAADRVRKQARFGDRPIGLNRGLLVVIGKAVVHDAPTKPSTVVLPAVASIGMRPE